MCTQINLVHTNIDENNVLDAVNILTDTLNYVCSNKKSKLKKDNGVRSKYPFWDDELEELRKVKYRYLRLVHRESNNETLKQYRESRNRFKKVLQIKQRNYRLCIRNKIENCNSAVQFWSEIRRLRGSKSCINTISATEWQDYFCDLLNNKNDIDKNFSEDVNEYMRWHNLNCIECIDGNNRNELNCDITLSEIDNVISSLKSGKAPGIDCITNECLKNSRIIVVPILQKLYNKILESGIYPDSWCEAVIIPIHKAGSPNDPGNYRGISLLSNISKIFTKILNERLVRWANENGKMFEEQGGFTKGKSTADHIFILQSLISKYLCKKGGRCYSVFVDFSKAFDSIPHAHMFYRMVTENLHGRIVGVLQNMYSKLKSCVQVDKDHLSKCFTCEVGTRQGCMLSPFLFIFYLNEFVNMCKTNSCNGIYVNETYDAVNMLLYADDLVIIGDTIGHVQRLLNLLNEYCSKWGLSVNMVKTKLMVYRNGGITKKNEKCYFNGIEIESVTYYKYLGVLISTRLSWSPAQALLATQGHKAMFLINKLNYEYEFPYHASCNIFDKCIVPIITYGSQIWGTQVKSKVENVLLTFCKKQLGVSSTTPSVAVLGECGSYPIFITCYENVIKYWLKIVSLTDECLLKSCYDMLLNYDLAGRKNWASEVKLLLYSYGFGYIWEEQHVDDHRAFIKIFRERMRDCYLQNWNTMKIETSKLALYSLYKYKFETEPYLTLNIPIRLRKYLAKFRTSSVNLEIEIGRRHNTPREDRLCKLCGETNLFKIEDEFHVLLECPTYNSLRKIYIGNNDISIFSFCKLMETSDASSLIRLGNFICTLFDIRQIRLESII